jgi:hypothetical protein
VSIRSAPSARKPRCHRRETLDGILTIAGAEARAVGVTRSGKALVSQCVPEAPIGVTFRQKVVQYQQTAQYVLNRAASRVCPPSLPPPILRECRQRGLLAASATLDWLDVMHPAPIPMTRMGWLYIRSRRRDEIQKIQLLKGLQQEPEGLMTKMQTSLASATVVV